MENIEIINQIKKVINPIAKQYGMTELPVIKHNNVEISFAYLSKGIGIEVSIELSDFFIFLLVFKPIGDKVPSGYEDEDGNVQKLYIQHALKKIGIDTSKETKEMQKLGRNYLNCMSMTNILARLYENNWSNIQSQADVIFRK